MCILDPRRCFCPAQYKMALFHEALVTDVCRILTLSRLESKRNPSGPADLYERNWPMSWDSDSVGLVSVRTHFRPEMLGLLAYHHHHWHVTSASSLDDNLCVVTSGHASPVPCAHAPRGHAKLWKFVKSFQAGKKRSVKLCMTLMQDAWQISSRRLTRMRSSAVLVQLTSPRYAAVRHVIGSFLGHLTHWATIAQIIII